MITSPQNAWIRRIREAIREHAEEIVIEGPKAVADALAHDWKAIAVFHRGSGRTSKVAQPSATALTSLPPRALSDVRPDPFEVAPELFDRLSETKTSQGVLALFKRPHHSSAALLAHRDSIIVALDAVQDPGNVGTIVRLAAAFDAAGVALLPGCADPFGPKAIRASAGAILNVPVATVTASDLIESFLPLFAAAGDGAPIEPPSRGAVLIFGNEGAGVSPELRYAATPIAIATSGRVESLNVAASAAILLARSFAGRMKG